MYEMQIIAIDVPVCQSVSLSVCHVASLGFGLQQRLKGLRWCFG